MRECEGVCMTGEGGVREGCARRVCEGRVRGV